MKAIQIMMDEDLLRRLDADTEVKKSGRSKVLRRAAAEYLRRNRASRIAEGYRRAYGNREALDSELAGWAEDAIWPEN